MITDMIKKPGMHFVPFPQSMLGLYGYFTSLLPDENVKNYLFQEIMEGFINRTSTLSLTEIVDLIVKDTNVGENDVYFAIETAKPHILRELSNMVDGDITTISYVDINDMFLVLFKTN